MTEKGDFIKFQTTRQEPLRLQIALSELTENQTLPEEEREAYLAYLNQRKRPAVEALVRAGNLEGLTFLYRCGILESKYLDDYGKLAVKENQLQIQWWLSYGIKESGVRTLEQPSPQTEEGETARRIWELTRRRAELCFPYLASAFCALKPKVSQELQPFGTDGKNLYFRQEATEAWFQRKPEMLMRAFLHMILHCLYLHIFSERPLEDGEQKNRDLACDIFVEAVIDLQFLKEPVSSFRKKWYALWKEQKCLAGPERMEAWLCREALTQEERTLLERDFTVDDHRKWYRMPGFSQARAEGESRRTENLGQRRAYLRELQNRVDFWLRTGQFSVSQAQQQAGKIGTAAGSLAEFLSLEKKKKYDYRAFLRRFAVFGEEVCLDLDQFDYIPYSYSREHYEKLVFLEPLEYTEVHKLQELVIAIDTSGSCSGPIVRRFMEETYQILSSRENFFRRMRVHIIQCDSMIQGYACIRDEEEWKDYLKNLKVQGFGGTDFRPVFRLVEELREKKEIQDLKGLLYFTDGDGIYPRTAPDYETAFVFLNEALEMQQVPSWAIKLNLELKINEY